MKNKNYIKGFLYISLFILVYIYLSILKPIYYYDSSRIYELTKVQPIYRVSLMNAFLDKQYEKDSILILGDSQPHGFRYPTKDVFPTLLSKKLGKKVINAAFHDARILDSIYVLEYLKSKNRKFDTIVFNINHAHIKQPNLHKLEMEHPVHYTIGILKNSKNFEYFTHHFNPSRRPNFIFHKYTNIPNFFVMPDKDLALYLSQFQKLIMLAKSISTQVIIYATAHCTEDLKRLKLNSPTIGQLDNKIQNICRESNVTFLKPDIVKKEYFNDLVHFNSKGHRKMAEILYKIVKK